MSTTEPLIKTVSVKTLQLEWRMRRANMLAAAVCGELNRGVLAGDDSFADALAKLLLADREQEKKTDV